MPKCEDMGMDECLRYYACLNCPAEDKVEELTDEQKEEIKQIFKE